MDNSAIVCDEIINVKETNFNEENIICKTQTFLYFTCFFINYYIIIDSC